MTVAEFKTCRTCRWYAIKALYIDDYPTRCYNPTFLSGERSLLTGNLLETSRNAGEMRYGGGPCGRDGVGWTRRRWWHVFDRFRWSMK